MRIEELLECDAATLKAMSDEQLLAHFEPMFKVTRPEFAVKPKAAESLSSIPREEQAKMKQDFAQLRALGIQIDEKEYMHRLANKRKK